MFVVQLPSHFQLFATPWTAASMLARSKIHAKPVDTWQADYLPQELVSLGEGIEDAASS